MEQTQPPPPPGQHPPTRFADRYHLGERIGFGGAAEVYRAWDEKLERAVAIKLFRTDVPGLDEAQRHRAEMRILARLNHPGLVAIYDAGVQQGPAEPSRSYLVMELVDGPSLASQLSAGLLSVPDTARLAVRLAGALAYVHEQRIVHRDVKPANVLLDKCSPALAKLTDFGIARSATDARLTGVGLTIGTAHYLSPEQALGAEVGPASDVYSLGLLLAECRSGRPAFAGTPIESALARLHNDPPIGEEAGELAPLLVAMTAREPRDRPTAAEVAVRAAELAGDTAELPVPTGWLAGGATALFAPVADHPGAGSGRRRPALVAGGAGVLLLGAVSSAVLLAGTDRKLDLPVRAPGQVTSSSASSKPIAAPPSRSSTARPTPSRTPSASSHPVQVVASPPASPKPKPKKGPPGKHGH
ncbi:MAG TPA: serine/threonine-protein kinase [Jatrophihabitans sp.]|nr:serine/threonine-protein kinase [Jatrophihabitans sp.]